MEDVPKPFFDHLEELRKRIFYCLAAVVLGLLISYQFIDKILFFISKPVGNFIFIQPMEAFMVRLKIALVSGVLLTMPFILIQIWRFILIALTPKEKNSLFWILPSSYILFMMGFSLGLFLLVPLAIKFLLSYGSGVLVPQISIDAYISFLGMICLTLGGIFQMPLLTFFLAKLGVLSWETLSEKRKIAVLVIYIASSLLTPGPDPISSLLLALCSYLLYECSILTAKLAAKQTV
ncbi:MAG: twin arginine-targeting protein translocase TatC [Elusimicrobia bacterium RIFCSPLOWO2_02_FULL_39_32]|nr:MAG: twin arginine-targeting protein translocase TatC [Elusimicrobia bacterium GWA2_38_7]OGR81301.1 MAG: twin arginine-targeting protein translocase TatC [Elusimicrobia bacterium RIFCSPHIGHO2_02_FULL_39_36]OGR91414.1 MAG: twin arginine-targeting protein translocase TatC [Elusimicrobia bacterium RIFCSPLOWO2_02_FULL_39_32]OGR98529.1 MAG: twin arginine-targeting protein translocase TatC [Elusimicrobia bacterium RIFCSPLOWO2_12_FULL_39_28]